MVFSSRSRMSNVFSLVVFVTFMCSLLFVASSVNISHARAATADSGQGIFCVQKTICTDPNEYSEYTVGHDEPSLLFYSNSPGSGNSYVSRLTLPNDPPTLPKQDGTGGTFNFQLHPAFWFGMAMCDTQSAPEFTNQCTPNSDANIFDSANPNAPDYMGKHPGGAFMEMQLYPPGWAPFQLPGGISCDATQWCGALTIDSFLQNQNNGKFNNLACRETVGDEPVNFAFITKNGVSQAPANPVDATAATFTPDPTKDLFMNSGDTLSMDLHDTSLGFQVVINDLTQHTSGSMTASIANGFGQVKFDPSGSGCTNIPNAFHPMYSTSSEHTRLTWTAHSYNTAFSDEIGHWEYCNAVDSNGNCTQDGVHDLDTTHSGAEDDNACLSAAASTRIALTGCAGLDADFDGVPYQLAWPGTLNYGQDKKIHAQPIEFTTPLINGTQAYSRVAFEADMPRVEFDTNPPCQRHISNPTDPNPGAGCVNPPVGSNFYPIFSTHTTGHTCLWALGGALIHGGKVNTFGGNSVTEYGQELVLTYPSVGGPQQILENFRQVLSTNPC